MGPLPQTPDVSMPQGWELLFTIACVVMVVIFAVIAFRMWRSTGDTVPALLLLGGAVCTFWEPIVDLAGLCYYPRDGQMKLFETFGRPIPLLVLPGYTWFVGGVSILVYRRILQHGTAGLMKYYVMMMVFTPPFEIFAVKTGVYHYYGEQPLSITGWPMWWLFVNTAMPICTALVVVAIRPHLTGWRILAVIALVPMVDGAVNAATAWPVWSALNGGIDLPLGQLAGITTCALSVLLVWTAIQLFTPAVAPAVADVRTVSAGLDQETTAAARNS